MKQDIYTQIWGCSRRRETPLTEHEHNKLLSRLICCTAPPSGVLRVHKSLSTRFSFFPEKNDEIFKALRIIICNLTYRRWWRRMKPHKLRRQFTNLNPINNFLKSRRTLISILTNFFRLASSFSCHKNKIPQS